MKVAVFLIGLVCLIFNVTSQDYHTHTGSHPENGIIIDTIYDARDSNSYEIILIDSMWWFNQNLNYRTFDSDCFDAREENCANFGNLYSFRESRKACPIGWRLPSKGEFDNLLTYLSEDEPIQYVGLIYLDDKWDNTDLNDTGFRVHKSGFKHKKKFRSFNSLNFWLEDDEEIGNHVHIYRGEESSTKEEKMVIFRHNHEDHNPIIDKRKFGVRCVCELKN